MVSHRESIGLRVIPFDLDRFRLLERVIDVILGNSIPIEFGPFVKPPKGGGSCWDLKMLLMVDLGSALKLFKQCLTDLRKKA